ncbi:MAG: helix-turn-helix transcriptional regulator [Candidatus Acidiferrales bacterium]
MSDLTKLLTTDEVAGLTGLSPETLAQWRWLRKEIPFVRLGTKCVRYRQSDIDAWLAKRLVSVTSGGNCERRR